MEDPESSFGSNISQVDAEDKDLCDGSAAKKLKILDTEVDNSYNLVLKLANLYAERLMNDIYLEVDGKEYAAHRIILCTSSEVFQAMLMNSNWSESRTDRVVLQESKPCAENFEKFLRYFYTGQISLNEATVMPILSLADKYLVKDLMQVCEVFMYENIPCTKHVVSWFQYTLGLGHAVAEACRDFIKWNFECVAAMNDFVNINSETLCHFLTQNDIVVQNEMSLFKYVMRWLEYQLDTEEDSSTEENFNLVETIISYIRFPMMTGKELAQLLLFPLVRTYKEIFIDRMTIGVAYHTGCPDEIYHILNSKLPQDKLLFTPRLYTDAKYSSPLHISHFDSIPPYSSRTLVFSSHSNPCDNDDDERPVEWVIDVFPKGVWFDKFSLIVLQGTLELPQVIKKTVRVSITCKDPPPDEYDDLRVKFGVLVTGVQNGIEYVKTIQVRTLRFNDKDRVFNLDDLLNYEELNPVRQSSAHGATLPRSAHLCANVLKLDIIIIPLSNYSETDCR